MIPGFRDDGYLPEGLHVATEADVTFRFGSSTSRRRRLILTGQRQFLTRCTVFSVLISRRALAPGFFRVDRLEQGADTDWHCPTISPLASLSSGPPGDQIDPSCRSKARCRRPDRAPRRNRTTLGNLFPVNRLNSHEQWLGRQLPGNPGGRGCRR